MVKLCQTNLFGYNYLIEIFLLHNTLEEITSVVSSDLYQIYIKNKLAQHIPYFYFS